MHGVRVVVEGLQLTKGPAQMIVLNNFQYLSCLTLRWTPVVIEAVADNINDPLSMTVWHPIRNFAYSSRRS